MENEMDVSLDVIAKRAEYAEYVNQHIENVHRAFDTYGDATCEAIGVDIEVLLELVETHDVSKLDTYEFIGYQQYFYPVDPENKKDPDVIKNFKCSSFRSFYEYNTT